MEKQLDFLSSRFYIYVCVSPTQDIYIDVFDIDKYGEPVHSTGRRYRGANLKKAIKKAYMIESGKWQKDYQNTRQKKEKKIEEPTQVLA